MHETCLICAYNKMQMAIFVKSHFPTEYLKQIKCKVWKAFQVLYKK